MDSTIKAFKKNIYRRIIVRTVILAIWVIGLAITTFTGEIQELSKQTSIYMMVAICAIGIIYAIRDLRRLRNEEYLKKAAVAQMDERNILINYKATRLTACIALCAVPVAMCILAYLGLQTAIDALAACVCAFVIIYLISWYALAKLN